MIDMVTALYRDMQRKGLATGNEAIYLRPELKKIIFGSVDTLIIDNTTLPIIADSHIPETASGDRFESDLFILDQDAFAEAAQAIPRLIDRRA